MMRPVRLVSTLIALATLLTMSPALAWADKHVKVSEYGEGRAYCPPRNAVIAHMAIRGGRCYQVGVIRNARGAFLAFLDPSVRIPRGRLQRLDGEEGRRITGRIIYLAPMPMTSQLVLVPVNTIQLVRMREEDEEDGDHHNSRGQLVVFLPSAPTPNVSVTISVTF